jgi:hypothetical protein
MKLSNYFNFSSFAVLMRGEDSGVCVDGVASDCVHITSGVPQSWDLCYSVYL